MSVPLRSSPFVPRVLIVDDDAEERRLMGLCVNDFGFAYSFASDGLEALNIMNRDRFDMVLMDIHLPEIDGITLTMLFRTKSDHYHRHLPIIALDPIKSNISKIFRKCGFTGYMVKQSNNLVLKYLLEKRFHLQSR